MKRFLLLPLLLISMVAIASPISDKIASLEKEGRELIQKREQIMAALQQVDQRLIEIRGALKEIQTLEKKK